MIQGVFSGLFSILVSLVFAENRNWGWGGGGVRDA